MDKRKSSISSSHPVTSQTPNTYIYDGKKKTRTKSGNQEKSKEEKKGRGGETSQLSVRGLCCVVGRIFFLERSVLERSVLERSVLERSVSSYINQWGLERGSLLFSALRTKSENSQSPTVLITPCDTNQVAVGAKYCCMCFWGGVNRGVWLLLWSPSQHQCNGCMAIHYTGWGRTSKLE